MKPETRKVLERAIDSEKEELMLKQPDEILHDFLTHSSKPEFEKDRTLVPVVRAELVKWMDDRMKAAFELLGRTHKVTDQTYAVTVKILWFTVAGVVLALSALLLGC